MSPPRPRTWSTLLPACVGLITFATASVADAQIDDVDDVYGESSSSPEDDTPPPPEGMFPRLERFPTSLVAETEAEAEAGAPIGAATVNASSAAEPDDEPFSAESLLRVFEDPTSRRPRSEPTPNLPPEAITPPEVPSAEPRPRSWSDLIQLRGYTQFRYNRIPSAVMNDDLINLQGDRSIGGGNGFAIRRARLVIFGDLHEHLSIYFQPDVVSVAGGQMNALVLRDWYADIFFDTEHRFRLRLGQSKVPYGFENMQSSQNRLALDRNDALNSAVRDERDLGAFLYYTPQHVQRRFRYLVESGLKGSGDYGVLALGVYNGQTANRPALSDDLHVIARVAYPFLIGSQYVEIGGGGYYGNYRIGLEDQETTRYRTATGDLSLVDARVFGTLVVYPQPLGFQFEATYGVGPSQGHPDAQDRNVIDSRPLWGGYVQAMLRLEDVLGTIALIPYVRATYYEGGKKFMLNAPRYSVREIEIGIEWQIFRQLEVVLAYDIVDRTSDIYPYVQQDGHVARIQVQVNYP